MFEDSLIESGGKLKTSRGRTTTFSFVLEAVIVGIMVLIPLLFTEALPKAQLMMALVAPPPPPPPPPPPAEVRIVKQVQTDLVNGQLRTPTKIPKKVEMIKEEEAPPPMTGVVGGVPGGVPGGQMNGVIGGIISNAPMAVPKVATPTRIRVSQGVTAGLVIKKVNPAYPPLARTARVQGSVLLAAVIGKDGTIQNLHVVSGHPLLTQAALDAVRQWRYKPYILNGEPVEVDTQVTVNFTLSGG
ncbi:MAG: Energy transducer TonB [Acidobacteriaceae bacterium]|nr:Energy transducer TonB [Acidobacteriaceae bacterium]